MILTTSLLRALERRLRRRVKSGDINPKRVLHNLKSRLRRQHYLHSPLSTLHS
ncbi:MAG: hypothetical protein ACI4RP_08545 [Acutalibacteraceae bacterium]